MSPVQERKFITVLYMLAAVNRVSHEGLPITVLRHLEDDAWGCEYIPSDRHREIDRLMRIVDNNGGSYEKLVSTYASMYPPTSVSG